MLARPAVRASLRRTNIFQSVRRAESTTAAAKDAAQKTTSKASEGLSKVTSAAGPAIAGAAKGAANALSRVGGPTAKLVSFIEKQTPFVIYYSKVGLELSKLVFKGQKMTPPSVSTLQSYYQSAFKAIQQPGQLLSQVRSLPQQASGAAQQARGVSTAQLVGAGVVLAECLGFFTVGEMIGRFKLVGYHGEAAGAHH